MRFHYTYDNVEEAGKAILRMVLRHGCAVMERFENAEGVTLYSVRSPVPGDLIDTPNALWDEDDDGLPRCQL
jgi:hypothetical protein